MKKITLVFILLFSLITKSGIKIIQSLYFLITHIFLFVIFGAHLSKTGIDIKIKGENK